MRLSTKGRYGMKAVLDLALHSNEGLISLKSIADRQEISENYLEQLFASLKKAGVVKSTRGSQGGYELGKAPSEISVGDILRALEGSLAPVECVEDCEQPSCEKSENCVTRHIWTKIHDSVNEVVDSISLEQLVEDCRKMSEKCDYTYYI